MMGRVFRYYETPKLSYELMGRLESIQFMEFDTMSFYIYQDPFSVSMLLELIEIKKRERCSG